MNPELAEDIGFFSSIEEMSSPQFSILSKARYRIRFKGEYFMKKQSLLERFPTISLKVFQKEALDLSHLLAPTRVKEAKKLLSSYNEENFR